MTQPTPTAERGSATDATWFKLPLHDGYYWMAYEDYDFIERTILVYINSRREKSLLWGGSGYSRSQFKNAMFHGPLMPPERPVAASPTASDTAKPEVGRD
jgi:hypothetical protein